MDEKIDKNKAPYPKKSLAIQAILLIGIPMIVALFIYYLMYVFHK